VLLWCVAAVPVIVLGSVSATPPPKVDVSILKKWGVKAVELESWSKLESIIMQEWNIRY
jgi:hypothetical protein